MPFFHAVFLDVVLWPNWWMVLLSFSAVLAWQDFKRLMVNRNLAILTCLILMFAHPINGSMYEACLSASVLLIYKKFRPRSIQTIDIAFFSLGILYMDQHMLPIYCFVIALFLGLFKWVLKQRRLPFLTAWFFGFWVVWVLK